MNNFSDKEYANLRNDTAEIRTCITRYVGYIISVTGFSGIIKYFIEEKNDSALGNLLLLTIALIVITFLFEVIWYKFKSHNRLVGYMQLLMQEHDAIPKSILDLDEISKKKYITNYKDYLRMRHPKGIKDFYSWEFVISRLHAVFFSKGEENEEKKMLLSSINKCQFVFSVSDRLYDKIKINNHDKTFFESIILELYPLSKDKYSIKKFFKSFIYLYVTDSKIVTNPIIIDKKYFVNGWRYPKKITQISFSAIIIIFIYFCYNIFSKYKTYFIEDSNNTIESIEIVMASVLFLISTGFLCYWVFKYLRFLPQIIYGKHSIDYYCWMFFVYRIQLLNSKGLIPIYFSRSFLRYFKTNMYARIFENSKENFHTGIKKRFALEELNEYYDHLSKFYEFKDKTKLEIHDIFVASYKVFEKSTDYTNDFSKPIKSEYFTKGLKEYLKTSR